MLVPLKILQGTVFYERNNNSVSLRYIEIYMYKEKYKLHFFIY